MDGNIPLLNWDQEARSVREFIQNESAVLHVYGGMAAQPVKFAELAMGIAQEMGRVSCVSIDHGQFEHGTPRGALEYIARELGLPIAGPPAAENRLRNLLSDITARKGDIVIANNVVTFRGGSEHEETIAWLNGFRRYAETTPDLRTAFIVVYSCDALTIEQSRAFASNVWDLALQPLTRCGLKLAFIMPPELAGRDAIGWPAPSNVVMELPTIFGRPSDTLVHQVATWLIQKGFASASDSACESARILLASSRTIGETYIRLGLLSDSRASLNDGYE